MSTKSALILWIILKITFSDSPHILLSWYFYHFHILIRNLVLLYAHWKKTLSLPENNSEGKIEILYWSIKIFPSRNTVSISGHLAFRTMGEGIKQWWNGAVRTYLYIMMSTNRHVACYKNIYIAQYSYSSIYFISTSVEVIKGVLSNISADL